MVHGSVQVKVLDADRHAFAFGVDRMLIKRHLDVAASALRVLTSPVYWVRLLPEVKRMRLVSAFSGRTLVTTCR
jgi:hypothetical protein